VKENRVIRKLKYYRLSQFSKEGGIEMPVVRIDLWKGRKKEKKKELIEKVTSVVVDAIGCPIEAVHVIINEVEKDDWGIGGTPASRENL